MNVYGTKGKALLRSSILHLIWKISPRLFRKQFKYRGQIFSIGIYTGKSPLSISDCDESENPVITANDISDIPAAFVADPFIIKTDQKWYMFFEIFNQIKRRGEIGLATSRDGSRWRYKKRVLKAPFHLSYPQVFVWNGQYFMIPESSQAGVRLYQAQKFPYRWKYLMPLIDQKGLLDSTIFFFNDTWWMFSSRDGGGPDEKTMHLYYADQPTGNWKEHPQSPIPQDSAHLARCAGRVVRYQGRLIRFAQNGRPAYGTDVHAFEILKLSRHEYRENRVSINPILSGSGQKWNQDGMHHIDAHRVEGGVWLACVDGWYANPKPRSASKNRPSRLP